MKKEFLVVLLLALAVLSFSGCETEKIDEYPLRRDYSTAEGDIVPFNIDDLEVNIDVQKPPYISDKIAFRATITNNSDKTLTAIFISTVVNGGSMVKPAIVRQALAPGGTKISTGVIDIDDANKIYTDNDVTIEKIIVEYGVTDDKKINIIFETENIIWEYYDK